MTWDGSEATGPRGGVINEVNSPPRPQAQPEGDCTLADCRGSGSDSVSRRIRTVSCRTMRAEGPIAAVSGIGAPDDGW